MERVAKLIIMASCVDDEFAEAMKRLFPESTLDLETRQFIDDSVETWPPMSDEQRRKIVRIFQGSATWRALTQGHPVE